MTLLRMALAQLRADALASVLNVLLLALGIASIVVLTLLSRQFGDALSRDARGIDLVVGAKGSPVQVVLSSVYHADIPTGNIPLADAQRIAQDPDVAQAIPLALGDSVRGVRIVGTDASLPALYGAAPERGRMFAAPLEAVLGAEAARRLHLHLGDTFTGAHGLGSGGHAHDEHPYRVVGILAPTGAVIDRLVLTPVQSVWDVHGGHDGHAHDEHGHDGHSHEEQAHDHQHDHPHDDQHDHKHDHDHDHADRPVPLPADAPPLPSVLDPAFAADEREITAMLVSYRSPLAAMRLPRRVNAEGALQAAAPAFEVARLLKLVGAGLDGLRAFAGLLVLTAGFGVFVALYAALKARRRELAMMRVLGATRGELVGVLLLEGMLLTTAGAVLGLLLGHAAVTGIGLWFADAGALAPQGWRFVMEELYILGGAVLLGLLAAAIPAWQAYRTDVAQTLGRP